MRRAHRLKEYNIVLVRPVSKVRDKTSTKSGTSSKAVTDTAAATAKLADSTGKPAEAESEYITARDEACSRPKQTNISRSGSR